MGNLLIGQSGGATAVINASLAGAVQEALRSDQIDGIYGALHGIEGVLKRQIIDLRQESDETWSRVLATPSAALGSCRYKLQPDDPARALEVLRALDVRYFLYIGGNDSADTAHRLALAAREADYDLRVIAIPKTIDNDLPSPTTALAMAARRASSPWQPWIPRSAPKPSPIIIQSRSSKLWGAMRAGSPPPRRSAKSGQRTRRT